MPGLPSVRDGVPVGRGVRKAGRACPGANRERVSAAVRYTCGSQILHRTLAPLPGSHHVHREAAAFLSTFRAAATFAENWAPEAAGAGRSREAAARDRRKIFL